MRDLNTVQDLKIREAIRSELDYADAKWGHLASSGRPGDGSRSIDEFILYIRGLSEEAAQLATKSDDGTAKLEILRKVCGLCWSCFRQHGVPLRK